MKTCAYCGSENPDEGTHCLSCGTELIPGPIDSKPNEPVDRSWIKDAFLWAGGALVVLLIYLLSLGPVQRCTGKVISYTTTPTANGFLGQRVVSYPRWVGVVYAPAFWLRQSGPWDLYDSYLEWWGIPESKK